MNPSQNGAFGSYGASTGSFGDGSMIVNAPVQAPSRKKWVIVAIVVLVLLAIGGIVLGLWQGGVFKGGSTEKKDNEYSIAAKQYASYLLYGDTTTDIKSEEFSSTTVYALDNALYSGDADYFESLKEYWDTFVALVEKDEKYAEDSSLSGNMESQAERMDFILRYVNAPMLSDEELLKLYQDKGVERAIESIDYRYADLLKTIYEQSIEQISAEIEFEKVMIEIYNYYDGMGCISGTALDETCLGSSAVPSDLWSKYDKYQDNELLEVVNSTVMMLEERSFRIVERTMEIGNEK